MKLGIFDGTTDELESFLRVTGRDVSDVFKIKDTSRTINIIFGAVIAFYIVCILSFSYTPENFKPLIKSIMIICTMAVPSIVYFKYWRLGVTAFVLVACIALTAIILGVADYNELYEMSKGATNKYIENQLK